MVARTNFLSGITGLFASPAAENPTIAMVEAAYRHHAIDARYLTCEVEPENLEAAVRGAVAMGWAGFHLSLPHKQTVIPFLDELAECAQLIGAVNCVVIRDGHLIGENTDGAGFITSLKETVDPHGAEVLVFGAVGAARAIAVELALAGVAGLTIVNRNLARGRELAQHITDTVGTKAIAVEWSTNFAVPASVTIVVNATSIGLYPDVTSQPAIDYDSLLPAMIVADVIPNPPRTAFLASAAARGCTTIDGLGMLVNQGVIGISLWSGVDVDPQVMRDELAQIFGA
jgi:shikimate dehydrogenase